MIALLSQAIQERAAIPISKKLPTFVYIDEARDYFDENIDILINTVRKFNVGIILATQNLKQLKKYGLLETVLSSTSIKYAGGVSKEDARDLAGDMRCSADSIMELGKTDRQSHFAFYDKNDKLCGKPGAPPTAYQVIFGMMEKEPRMTARERARLIADNRARYCAPYDPSLVASSQAAVLSGINFNLDEPHPL